MCVIWGMPYLFIKVAVEEISPATLVLGRTALAALLLLPIAVVRHELRPLLPYWAPLLVFAAIEIAIPWVLLGVAEQEVSSSLTGLLLAAVPLVGAAIALASKDGDRIGLRNGIGLVLGLAGVAAIVGLNLDGARGRPRWRPSAPSRSATRSARSSSSATWPGCRPSASSPRRSPSRLSSTCRSRRSASRPNGRRRR